MRNDEATSGKKVNRTELATFMGRNRLTIDAWVKEGMPGAKVGAGWQFDTALCIEWYARRCVKEVTDNVDGDSSVTGSVAYWRAKTLELKYNELKARFDSEAGRTITYDQYRYHQRARYAAIRYAFDTVLYPRVCLSATANPDPYIFIHEWHKLYMEATWAADKAIEQVEIWESRGVDSKSGEAMTAADWKPQYETGEPALVFLPAIMEAMRRCMRAMGEVPDDPESAKHDERYGTLEGQPLPIRMCPDHADEYDDDNNHIRTGEIVSPETMPDVAWFYLPEDVRAQGFNMGMKPDPRVTTTEASPI
jgi:hypothetical protein